MVWRYCIDRPRQSFDYGVMGVNHPAAGFGVANSAMVLLQKLHGLGFTAAGEFCPTAPGEEIAGLFVVVVDLLVSNACGLGEKARVGVKVEDAGQETALLQNGSDVAVGACVTGVDVNCFRGSGRGAGCRRWYGSSGLVDQTGNVDAVVGEGVVCISGIIPLHMGELAEVGQVVVSEADVSEKLCNVLVLWCVFRSQLCGVEIEPPYYLVLFGKVPEMWWR